MLKSKYLYVGCGSHKLEGFIHADISVYKLSKITEVDEKNIHITTYCNYHNTIGNHLTHL